MAAHSVCSLSELMTTESDESHFFSGSPLIRADRQWEANDCLYRTLTPDVEAASKKRPREAAANEATPDRWDTRRLFALQIQAPQESFAGTSFATSFASRWIPNPNARLSKRPSYNVCSDGHLTHHGEDLTVTSRDALVCPNGLNEVSRVRRLGRGASGSVYEGIVRSGQKIAVKEIKGILDNQALRHQAFRELKILTAAHHPNLVELRQAFFHEGVISLCLDYCDAGSLEHVVEHGGALSEAASAATITQVACGLDYIHTVLQHIHRDVKPANVLLTHNGRAKVADFGLSLDLEHMNGTAQTPAVSGTVAFLAPELYALVPCSDGVAIGSTSSHGLPARSGGASYTAKVDVWALGLVTVEALHGQAPFAGLDRFKLTKILSDASLALPQVDESKPEARDFVSSCLQRVPDRRPDCSELMQHVWISALVHSLPEAEELVRGHLTRSMTQYAEATPMCM